MEETCFHHFFFFNYITEGLFRSTVPVRSSGFVAPSWLPVGHYRKDNHSLREPREVRQLWTPPPPNLRSIKLF